MEILNSATRSALSNLALVLIRDLFRYRKRIYSEVGTNMIAAYDKVSIIIEPANKKYAPPPQRRAKNLLMLSKYCITRAVRPISVEGQTQKQLNKSQQQPKPSQQKKQLNKMAR